MSKHGEPPGNQEPMAAQLESLRGAIVSIIEKEDLSERIRIRFDGSGLQTVEEEINKLLSFVQERTEGFHNSSMELSLGLAECFQVLAEVRKGNLQARVSAEAVNSTNEVVAELARAINDTVADLEEQMETIHRQQVAILELSTPVLQLWDKVIALPIIGVVDTRRSAEIMERLLEEISRRKCKFVILDITGVEVVDTGTAEHFIRVVKAAQMLGTTCMITGIRPAVAQTLVGIGVELSEVMTMGDLQEGLQECLRRMYKSNSVSI